MILIDLGKTQVRPLQRNRVSTMPTTPPTSVKQLQLRRQIVRDIGDRDCRDGLTVPFALAAGLTGAVDTTTIIITAGIAEIAARFDLPWGLGRLSGWKGPTWNTLRTERAREMRETEEVPRDRGARRSLEDFSVLRSRKRKTVGKSSQGDSAPTEKRWVDFMMRVRVGAWRSPTPRRARNECDRDRRFPTSPVGLGARCPPYFFFSSGESGICRSLWPWTLVALAVFGYVKGRFTVAKPLKSALADRGRRWVGGCGCVSPSAPHDWMTYMTPSEIRIEQCEAARELEKRIRNATGLSPI